MAKSFIDTLHIANTDPSTKEALIQLICDVIDSLDAAATMDTTDIVDVVLLKIPEPVNVIDADWFYAVAYNSIGEVVNQQLNRP